MKILHKAIDALKCLWTGYQPPPRPDPVIAAWNKRIDEQKAAKRRAKGKP